MANLHIPTLSKAAREVARRLKYQPEKQINEDLEYFCGTLAQAFKAGAEEAQSQLLARLNALTIKAATGKGEGR